MHVFCIYKDSNQNKSIIGSGEQKHSGEKAFISIR